MAGETLIDYIAPVPRVRQLGIMIDRGYKSMECESLDRECMSNMVVTQKHSLQTNFMNTTAFLLLARCHKSE